MDMKRLLKTIEEKAPLALEETYWLCIFAVNEHASICGDCWSCRGKDKWCPEQFAENPCSGCGKVKFNPCGCLSRKLWQDDDDYEIDKFDEVVKLMEGGLVVSLDPQLAALKRVWVVAEIAEVQRVCFQL